MKKLVALVWRMRYAIQEKIYGRLIDKAYNENNPEHEYILNDYYFGCISPKECYNQLSSN